MTAHDTILRLVEMLMSEKDKNTQLQLALQLKKQAEDAQTAED